MSTTTCVWSRRVSLFLKLARPLHCVTLSGDVLLTVKTAKLLLQACHTVTFSLPQGTQFSYCDLTAIFKFPMSRKPHIIIAYQTPALLICWIARDERSRICWFVLNFTSVHNGTDHSVFWETVNVRLEDNTDLGLLPSNYVPVFLFNVMVSFSGRTCKVFGPKRHKISGWGGVLSL
jgi:hypothetical protein